MAGTVVVFVHGFTSGPDCWDSFVGRLERDPDLPPAAYRFIRYDYPTALLELSPARRVPSIKECANSLGNFLDSHADDDQLFLVGHSMGGLVIQQFLAQKILDQRGKDLARIRSVILFATPNRGSNVVPNLRGAFFQMFDNPQEEELRVLNTAIAEVSDVITRFILDAKNVDKTCCPIPFRAFWGLEDAVVTAVSAKGPFVEANGLRGDHSSVIDCEPTGKDDRYEALKNSILHPVGHPGIYEIDLFEVTLEIAPSDPAMPVTLSGEVRPLVVHADNVAVRTSKFVFSKQNRCSIPYLQVYRSEQGAVEVLDVTQPNQASAEAQSTYYETGKRFSYEFTPDRGDAFEMVLRIYNGFGEGQRSWHNHMKPNARYKLFRFALDLDAYRRAGYIIKQTPELYFYDEDIMDHNLCKHRVRKKPIPPLPASTPWSSIWELADLRRGVVDIVWDIAVERSE
jgi:pimeloyl-ACP methyl ester carboxylesterase